MEDFSSNPLFVIGSILHIWMQELNQESQLWMSLAQGCTIPFFQCCCQCKEHGSPHHHLALATAPGRSPECWGDLAWAGGCQHPNFPHYRAAQQEQPRESWLLGTKLSFVVSSTITVQQPKSHTHLTWANPVHSVLVLTKEIPLLLVGLFGFSFVFCFAHLC